MRIHVSNALADGVPLHAIEDALDHAENTQPPTDAAGLPERYPADEQQVDPMECHAMAVERVSSLLVDVDDEIALRIANALDFMASSMIALNARLLTAMQRNSDLVAGLNLHGGLSQSAATSPVDAAIRAMERTKESHDQA